MFFVTVYVHTSVLVLAVLEMEAEIFEGAAIWDSS